MAVVVIDPGHFDYYNSGACEGYYESNAMLTLAEYLGEALLHRGAQIRFTRDTTDENPSIEDRGLMAEGADLFISLHSDASDISSARGATVYYSVQQPSAKPFAVSLGRAVSNTMGIPFRGAVARPSETTAGTDYLGVLRAAVSTGIPYAFLVEHGFHSNPSDCAILSQNANLWRIAEAEADVIAQYLGLAAPANCSVRYQVKPGETLYYIGQSFGVPWQMIAEDNNIYPPYTVYPGQNLYIVFPEEWCAD